MITTNWITHGREGKKKKKEKTFYLRPERFVRHRLWLFRKHNFQCDYFTIAAVNCAGQGWLFFFFK